MSPANPILVQVWRGDRVESLHRGAAVVADTSGRRIAAWGDVDQPVFPRSAVKPLQALPLVETGAADRFGLGDAELALACASHDGRPEPAGLVAAWLVRVGVRERDLACGPQMPFAPSATATLIREGAEPSRLNNNCSGKHAGFLTICRYLDEPIAGYVDPDHPVQRRVRSVLEAMTNTPVDTVAVDGCGAPTLALPLAGMATALARMASPDAAADTVTPERAAAAARLLRAMTAHPDLVAGPGSFDTTVIRVTGGGAVLKVGAEGVHGAILPRSGLGIAVKIDDGAKRATEVAMATLLLRHAGLDGPARQAVAAWASSTVFNWAGTPVGRMAPAPGWSDG